MSIRQAFNDGIAMASRHWRAILLIYLVNLALSAAVAYPVFRSLDTSLSHTESAEVMAGSFDWLWHLEFGEGRDPDSDPSAHVSGAQKGAIPLLAHFEGYVTGRLRLDLPGWLAWYAFAYLIVMVLMTGGVLGLYCEPGARFSMRLFFDRGGRYFFSLLAILAAAQVLYLLLWGVLGGTFEAVLDTVRSSATTEWTPMSLYWGFSLLLMVLALGIHMVMDYARVATVAWEKLGFLPAVLGAFGFCSKRLRATMGLFYLVTLTGLGVVGIFALLIGAGSGTSGAGLFLMALLQQAMVLGLIWLRMVYLATALNYYRGTMNMPSWVVPAGPPPGGMEDQAVLEEAALVS